MMGIEQAQAALAAQLMVHPGITGVAIGERNQTPCILVYVVELTATPSSEIPTSFQGYDVVVHESGEIRAL